METNETKAFFKKFKTDTEKMKQLTPNAVSGFMGLFQKVMGDGEISAMQKELIAVGIAVALQCAPCIRLHVQKALAARATKEQILEAASVAVMMGAGPAFTHLTLVIDTLEALQA